MTMHDTSMSMSAEPNKEKFASAKTKIENYLKSNDISLGVMFQVIDTDSSGAMEYTEFKSKV
jgi:hypothetical protein